MFCLEPEKKAFARCEKEVTKAHEKATSTGLSADQAEKQVRDKHENKVEDKQSHEVRKEIYLKRA